MSLEKTINDAIKVAMKSKDQASLRALRAIKSAILLAKTESGAKEELAEEVELKMLSKMAKQRRDSFDIYQKEGREDLAAKEKEELDVIEQFLPEQMSEEELRTGLKEILSQVGASGPQDMGKVMGAAMGKFSGKADGKMISKIVKELLTQ